MRMRQLITILSILGLTICFVNAQELTVVTEEYPPFNFTENGHVKGESTEIVRAALKKAGIKAEILVYPWARAYAMALNKENVLIYSIARTPEREKLFKWIGPVATAPDVCLFKLKERKDIRIQSLDDAKKYRIGVVRGWADHQHLVKLSFERIDDVSNDDANIKKLFAGRVDLIVGTYIQLPDQLKRLGLSPDKTENTKVVLSKGEDYYMAFSKQTKDELVEKTRAAFAEIKKK